METDHILNKKRHQNLNRISNSKFKQNLKKRRTCAPSPKLSPRHSCSSVSEEILTPNSESNSSSGMDSYPSSSSASTTIIHAARTFAQHTQRAISLSQSNCRNQSVTISQSVAISLSLSQSVCRNHDQSVAISLSQSVGQSQSVSRNQSVAVYLRQQSERQQSERQLPPKTYRSLRTQQLDFSHTHTQPIRPAARPEWTAYLTAR